MTSPLLWYLNRSTGVVLLVLLTLAVLLGIWSGRGDAGTRLPRFAVQRLHRNLGLLTIVLLALHVSAAVVDEYVDIRWWQSMLPWQLHYKPVWLALGVLALDLLLAATLTSLVRHRIGHRAWRLVHWGTYAAWGAAVVHGFGIGTDSPAAWARWTYASCVLAVLVLLMLRVVLRAVDRRHAEAGAPTSLPMTAGSPR